MTLMLILRHIPTAAKATITLDLELSDRCFRDVCGNIFTSSILILGSGSQQRKTVYLRNNFPSLFLYSEVMTFVWCDITLINCLQKGLIGNINLILL